jgi:hypothetical protein
MIAARHAAVCVAAWVLIAGLSPGRTWADPGRVVFLGIQMEAGRAERRLVGQLEAAAQAQIRQMGRQVVPVPRLAGAEQACVNGEAECLQGLTARLGATLVLGGRVQSSGNQSYSLGIWLYDAVRQDVDLTPDEDSQCKECDAARLAEHIGRTVAHLLDRHDRPAASAPQARPPLRALPRLLLGVTRSGRGAGAVVSEPGGIACGARCSAEFPAGASVTLRAEPAAGSVLGGWSAPCAGVGPCQIAALAAPLQIEVRFDRASTRFPGWQRLSSGSRVLVVGLGLLAAGALATAAALGGLNGTDTTCHVPQGCTWNTAYYAGWFGAGSAALGGLLVLPLAFGGGR